MAQKDVLHLCRSQLPKDVLKMEEGEEWVSL
jgi:hypothetical protein